MGYEVKSRMANLFVVGAAKAGTTSLCSALAQHPEIFFPAEKEPHFFVFPSDGTLTGLNLGVAAAGLPLERSRFVKDLEEYNRLYRAGAQSRFRGDGSTQYLVSECASRQIYGAVPDARILIQLREPLARAWSAYCYAVSKGDETETFRAALEEEINGLRRDRFYGGYLNSSVYGKHVSRFLELFGAERVQITFFEEFIKRPKATLDCLVDRLGLERFAWSPQDRANPTVVFANPVLRAVRTTGSKLAARHAWFRRFPHAKRMHSLLLGLGHRPPQGPSTEDAGLFRDLLWEQAMRTPLASIIGAHPYEGV